MFEIFISSCEIFEKVPEPPPTEYEYELPQSTNKEDFSWVCPALCAVGVFLLGVGFGFIWRGAI